MDIAIRIFSKTKQTEITSFFFFKFQVPIEKFYNAHVRFEFRHCSAKDKNDKKLLGFAFLHLMDMDETTVKDGSHSLCLYKCEDVNRFENSAIYLAMPSKLSEVTSLEQVGVL